GRLGLHINQPVTVRSAVGELRGILVRAYDIRPGNVLMYFPEANVLVPTTTDPLSKTPAFKSVLVSLAVDSLPGAAPEAALLHSNGAAGRMPLAIIERR